MDKDEELSKWIDSLSHEKLKDVAFQCINELILTESIRYYPEDEERTSPYWEVNGDRLDED